MRILDLFCGAGGAAMGLHQAFPDAEIVGVDIRHQPHFPFLFGPFTFVLADAMTYPLDGFDFIWASPPCQAYTPLKALSPDKVYPDLIAATRARLTESGTPWIIENVPGAPLLHYITLCGTMFDLRVYRHRRFEASWPIAQPPHPQHIALTATKRRRERWDAGWFISVTGDGPGAYTSGLAMGINWMNGNELSQAIPPAYSRYLAQFIPHADEVAA